MRRGGAPWMVITALVVLAPTSAGQGLPMELTFATEGHPGPIDWSGNDSAPHASIPFVARLQCGPAGQMADRTYHVALSAGADMLTTSVRVRPEAWNVTFTGAECIAGAERTLQGEVDVWIGYEAGMDSDVQLALRGDVDGTWSSSTEWTEDLLERLDGLAIYIRNLVRLMDDQAGTAKVGSFGFVTGPVRVSLALGPGVPDELLIDLPPPVDITPERGLDTEVSLRWTGGRPVFDHVEEVTLVPTFTSPGDGRVHHGEGAVATVIVTGRVGDVNDIGAGAILILAVGGIALFFMLRPGRKS